MAPKPPSPKPPTSSVRKQQTSVLGETGSDKVTTRSQNKPGNGSDASLQPKGGEGNSEFAAMELDAKTQGQTSGLSVKDNAESDESGEASDEDYENDYLDDVVEDGGPFLVPFCFVLFGRMYAEYKEKIIQQIGEDIRDDPSLEGCDYVVDHDRPVRNNPDLWRLCVAFESAEHCASFQARKVVQVLVDGGKRKLTFNISQPDLSWALDDGSIRLFVKNIPAKQITLPRLKSIFRDKKFGKAKRPVVKEVLDIKWATHNGGFVPRPMASLVVAPHDDDPQCEEVVPIIRIPFGRPADKEAAKKPEDFIILYVGCSLHKCNICNRSGHLMEVHKQWAERVKGKKRSMAAALIQNAKRTKPGMPLSPSLCSACKIFRMSAPGCFYNMITRILSGLQGSCLIPSLTLLSLPFISALRPF